MKLPNCSQILSQSCLASIIVQQLSNICKLFINIYVINYYIYLTYSFIIVIITKRLFKFRRIIRHNKMRSGRDFRICGPVISYVIDPAEFLKIIGLCIVIIPVIIPEHDIAIKTTVRNADSTRARIILTLLALAAFLFLFLILRFL